LHVSHDIAPFILTPLPYPLSLSLYISIYIVVGSSSKGSEQTDYQWLRVFASRANDVCKANSSYNWQIPHYPWLTHYVAETQDNINPAHMASVDAHFDSLSKTMQRKARAAGFRPYRELPRSGDTVMELDEAKACWRLRQDDGEDATALKQMYTRAEVQTMVRVLLDSIGSRRCAYLRGQTEVIRIGLGIGSKHSMRKIAGMLGLSAVSSVHEQVACFRAKWHRGMKNSGKQG